MKLTEGQVSDYKGAALLMDALPEARELLADRGYDADLSYRYFKILKKSIL